MQIHEVTARGLRNKTKNVESALGSAVGDELERLAFGSPITDYSQAAQPAQAKAQPKVQGSTATARPTEPDAAAQNQTTPPGATTKPTAGTQMATTTPDPEVLDPVSKAAQKPAATALGDVIDIDARVVPDPNKVAKLPKPVAQLPRPATTVPNFAQTNRTKYQPATVNAPVATVPNMPPTVPPKPAAPKVNPAAAPVVYQFDGRALSPQNARDAGIIKQLQAAGVTSGPTSTPAQAAKARSQQQDAIQRLRQTAVRTGDRDYLRQLNKLAGLPPDSTVGT